jgi:rubrerythrin
MSRPRHTLGISKLRHAELLSGPYLEVIAKHEAMVRCLYQTFAIVYPSMRKFWTHIADEEEQHFRMVQALQGDIKNSEIAFKRPTFTLGQVKDSIAWICARKERVQAGGVSINEALSMCIQIEQSMVEHRFFDVVADDHEKVSHVMLQLEKSSIVHLRRARIESKRIKWKIFGSKTNKPMPESDRLVAPIDTKTDPKVAVKVAQAAILAALINMEESASSLYKAFGELLPDNAKLWGQLSADERTHATMLHKLEDMLDKGEQFQHLGQFGISGLQHAIDDIRNAETKARRDGISSQDAMVLALRTESYMAECEFYKTVESTAPEFKYIAERLIDLTDKHIQTLQSATSVMEAPKSMRNPEPRDKWLG